MLGDFNIPLQHLSYLEDKECQLLINNTIKNLYIIYVMIEMSPHGDIG